MDHMSNPLLAPSALPFSLPDYANLTDEHVREAVSRGMEEQLAELERIATDESAATVENVLHAWELSGATLRRAIAAFWVARSAHTTPERDAIMAELAPRIAAHQDTILLHRGLYDRLRSLAERADSGELTLDEQDRFNLHRRLKDYERGGITLSQEDQQRLRELHRGLATLATQFQTLVTAVRNADALLVSASQDLGWKSIHDEPVR